MGACEVTVDNCVGGAEQACTPGIPTAETCNGVDDDCNGSVDEGFGQTTCGVGACEVTVDDCVAGVPQTCTPGTPSAEACNDLDDDCDGVVDNGFDIDQDGFTTCAGDCNDANPLVNPAATEICNGTDDNCDTVIDEGFDLDGDGFTTCAGDCNDANPAINPAITEVCNGIDDNCLNGIDEGFLDTDSDAIADCVDPDDDNDGVQDGADNCPLIFNPTQGDIDGDGAGDACDDDADGDGFGTSIVTFPDRLTDGEAPISGTVTGTHTDTHTSNNVYQAIEEIESDGPGSSRFTFFEHTWTFSLQAESSAAFVVEAHHTVNDEGDDVLFSYSTDGTNFVNMLVVTKTVDDGSSVSFSLPPALTGTLTIRAIDTDRTAGNRTSDTLFIDQMYIAFDPIPPDCDDLDPTAFPGGTEVCDLADNDCNGTIDEGFDVDQDGFTLCGGDCNDSDPAISPSAPELCDGTDNNCDGLVDEGFDADLDGFTSCAGDCDDADPAINPSVAEICDGIDNDCDATIDEPDAVDASTWYQDADGDGFGDPGVQISDCNQPAGFVTDDRDCNDGDAAINPAATEVCDGADNDCDDAVDEPDAADALTWYQDGDGDGFGDANSTTPGCTQPAGFVADNQDCDDGNASVNPAALEICNSIDDDCNGSIDENQGQTTCGVGACQVTVDNCIGGVPQTCTPGTPTAEVCDNSVDNDCNGSVDDGLGQTTCGLGPCEHHGRQLRRRCRADLHTGVANDRVLQRHR